VECDAALDAGAAPDHDRHPFIGAERWPSSTSP